MIHPYEIHPGTIVYIEFAQKIVANQRSTIDVSPHVLSQIHCSVHI